MEHPEDLRLLQESEGSPWLLDALKATANHLEEKVNRLRLHVAAVQAKKAKDKASK